MNAVSSPTCIAPLSTRIAPNHTTATVERRKITESTGIVTANRRIDLERRLEEVVARHVEAALLARRGRKRG